MLDKQKGYILYFVACFVAIIGGIALLSSSSGTGVRGGETQDEEIMVPPPFERAPVFNDPESQIIEQFIDVNGRRRRFKMFVPGLYFRANVDVPLVFVFHGSLGTAEAIQGSYGMDSVAETENFIVVYPAGEGRNFEVFTLENNKDLDFTLAMLNFVKSEYNINSEAIYSTGYSNGGFLSTMIACSFPNIFAGVAPMAGTFDTGVLPNCNPSQKIPYLQIHGSRDSIVPYNGNRNIVSVENTLAFWAEANGQDSTPIVTDESSGVQVYNFGPENIVRHYRLEGIGHLNVIDAFPAQTIINFFKEVTVTRNGDKFFGNLGPNRDEDSQVLEQYLDVNGRRRRFKIFVPGIYFRTTIEVPLVFVFHGSLGTAEAIQGSYGMDDVAEAENFIAVYPAGEGRNFEVFTLENNKDLDFTLAMLDFMKTEFRIKESSVYSTGYSNGGFLSTMIACSFPDKFAAVAPMAGTFDTGVLPDCAPSQKIPYLEIHGAGDFIVPYNGNRNIVSVEDTITFWAEVNGQDSTPTMTEEETGVTLYSFAPDNIVQHYTLDGIGHLNVIEAFPAQTIINFFKQVSDF